MGVDGLCPSLRIIFWEWITMAKPVKSSKGDSSRLENAARAAEAVGNTKAAKKIRAKIRERNKRDTERAADYKKAQSNPYTRYNPNGPN